MATGDRYTYISILISEKHKNSDPKPDLKYALFLDL